MRRVSVSCEQTRSPENELISTSETECKSNIHFCKLMRGTRGTRDRRAEKCWTDIKSAAQGSKCDAVRDRQRWTVICSWVNDHPRHTIPLFIAHSALLLSHNEGTIRYYFHHPSVVYVHMFSWNLACERMMGLSELPASERKQVSCW